MISAEKAYWIDLKRRDPTEYARLKSMKSLRLWKRNKRLAEINEGFFKVDYCDAMINLYVSRLGGAPKPVAKPACCKKPTILERGIDFLASLCQDPAFTK